jgi:hypothetical protein
MVLPQDQLIEQVFGDFVATRNGLVLQHDTARYCDLYPAYDRLLQQS